MGTRHSPAQRKPSATPGVDDDDGLARAERERLQRRFALAGGSAASRQLFDLLLAYRLSRLRGGEGRR